MSELLAFFPSWDMMLYLAVMGFVAAFIYSVVGGGGLISVPTLLATGLNPVLALGTNKASAVMGAATGAFTFFRSGKVDMSLMKYLFPAAFFGSIGGVIVLRQIPPDFLRPLVVVLLVLVTLYSVFKKEWGRENTYKGLTPSILRLSLLASAVVGFYDGFFGPGAGSFLLFSFLLIGFDFLRAGPSLMVFVKYPWISQGAASDHNQVAACLLHHADPVRAAKDVSVSDDGYLNSVFNFGYY